MKDLNYNGDYSYISNVNYKSIYTIPSIVTGSSKPPPKEKLYLELSKREWIEGFKIAGIVSLAFFLLSMLSYFACLIC